MDAMNYEHFNAFLALIAIYFILFVGISRVRWIWYEHNFESTTSLVHKYFVICILSDKFVHRVPSVISGGVGLRYASCDG